MSEREHKLVWLLQGEIDQLLRWANESSTGGWSTHQVEPMRMRASRLSLELHRISREVHTVVPSLTKPTPLATLTAAECLELAADLIVRTVRPALVAKLLRMSEQAEQAEQTMGKG